MATRTSHLLRPHVVRPLVALVALVAAMAAFLLVYGASPAHASLDSCSTTAGTTTCTYVTSFPNGSEDTFEVPAGVSTIHVVATGADGATGIVGGLPGRGAQVSGDLAVTPGQKLYVNVGDEPSPDRTGDKCSPGIRCIGGFNGGGDGVSKSDNFPNLSTGGGGGGASDVRFIPRGRNNTLVSRLIVAAGGGGSGSSNDMPGGCEGSPGDPALLGGAGGDAGSDGGAGQVGQQRTCTPVKTTAGAAGTETAGGAGGAPDGQSGTLGQGGNGGGPQPTINALPVVGGGGGGGLFGGGGGGVIDLSPLGPPEYVSTGGGGGGGSNLVPEGGTATLNNSGDPSIVISYQGVSEPPPQGPEDKQACKKGGFRESGFMNQGQCIKAVNAKN